MTEQNFSYKMLQTVSEISEYIERNRPEHYIAKDSVEKMNQIINLAVHFEENYDEESDYLQAIEEFCFSIDLNDFYFRNFYEPEFVVGEIRVYLPIAIWGNNLNHAEEIALSQSFGINDVMKVLNRNKDLLEFEVHMMEIGDQTKFRKADKIGEVDVIKSEPIVL